VKRLTFKAKVQLTSVVELLQKGVSFEGVDMALEIDVDLGQGDIITLTDEHRTAQEIFALAVEMTKKVLP
jgi:hypothetical protein